MVRADAVQERVDAVFSIVYKPYGETSFLSR